MALAAGHFYTPKSDSTQLLLCTDAAGFEFQQLPSGNVQKYAADPSGQLQDLQTLNLSAGGAFPSDGPFPSCKLDGDDYQIMEGFSTDATFPNTSMVILRPKGKDFAQDKAAYLAVPVACVTDTNPPNIFPPQVFSVTPASGPAAGGTPVVIKGTGFLNGAVDVGGAASNVVIVSDTEIHCNSHAHAAGAVHASVVTAGGTSAANPSAVFTFT